MYTSMRVSKTSPEARLARFHPVRFYLMRDDDLWVSMVEKHAEDIKQDRKFALLGVGERLYHLNEEHELLSGLERYTFPKERLQRAFTEEFGEANNLLESAVNHWFESGEQIFDLSAISAMFLDSDATRTPVGRLKLPYDSFFVHWGRHLELMSPVAGRFIEGCYVTRYTDDHMIDLTFVTSLAENDEWDKRSLLANLVVDGEGVYGVMLQTDADGTIRDALTESMKLGFNNEAGVLRWTDYIEPAINMAANCLCYLSSPKAEIENGYPREAPERLVKQAATGTPSEQRRGRSKLQNLGFRQIKLCGRRLAESIGIAPGSKEMPPHWRKGHWWPARIGKGRAEVRMDWRDGVVVNAKNGAPHGGHIYKP